MKGEMKTQKASIECTEEKASVKKKLGTMEKNPRKLQTGRSEEPSSSIKGVESTLQNKQIKNGQGKLEEHSKNNKDIEQKDENNRL